MDNNLTVCIFHSVDAYNRINTKVSVFTPCAFCLFIITVTDFLQTI